MTTETKTQQTLGNRLKFKLEMMMMLVMSDRSKEAAVLYDQLIAEFDKLGSKCSQRNPRS